MTPRLLKMKSCSQLQSLLLNHTFSIFIDQLLGKYISYICIDIGTARSLSGRTHILISACAVLYLEYRKSCKL